ncbi:hypothetical protein WDW86_15765 [Bdellovibrionota bacterium FG-2]
MDSKEKSLLAFLAEAVIGMSTCQQFRQMELEMERRVPVKRTPEFKRALRLVLNVSDQINSTPPLSYQQRLKKVQDEAKKYSRATRVADRSVSEALEWAALNWQRKKRSGINLDHT